jgi:hypothetical protein
MTAPLDPLRFLTPVNDWLKNQSDRNELDALVSLLGCPGLSSPMKDWLRETYPWDECLISAAWEALLMGYSQKTKTAGAAGRFILAGLLQNNRWVPLLERNYTAHALVALLARKQIPSAMTRPELLMQRDSERRAMAIIHRLVGPTYKVGGHSWRAFAKELFGEPWCALVYDSQPEGAYLTDLILRTRPEFLPGVLRDGPPRGSTGLPALE